VGFYLQSDIGLIPQSAKLYIFINALRVTTSERQIIRDQLQTSGKTLVWLYAPGVFDEKGLSRNEVSEIVGVSLKAQPWNSRVGTLFTEERHPIIERLRGGKRMGADDLINPSFTTNDPTVTVLGEYAQTGSPSVVARIMPGGWKTVFIGEPHLTGELIRGLYRFAGVHVYDAQDDVVVEGNGVLLIHAPYTGQRTISLPQPSAVYCVSEYRLISPQINSFRHFMRGRSTHFFLMGSLAEIAQSLDITEADLLATSQPAAERPTRNDGGDGRRREASDRRETGEHLENDEPGSEFSVVAEVLDAVVNPEVLEGLPTEDELLGRPEVRLDAENIDQATPSKRRRWNRRRQRVQRSGDSTPVSIDSMLQELAPRRIDDDKE
jgi:hypothetical protein